MHHEIGCHSFSHQQFGDPGCTEELARAEVAKCVELMKTDYDLVPETFAFPRDYAGNLSVLKELGFTSFRDTPAKLYPCLRQERTVLNFVKTQMSLAAQFLSYYLFIPPHVVLPRECLPDLWGIQSCLAYGHKPGIPLWLVTMKAKQGISKAIRSGKVFTMYTHLKDFGADSNFLHEFEKVVKFVNHKRREGKLDVKTMSKLSRGLTF